MMYHRECPQCAGDGTVLSHPNDPMALDVTCSDCNGEGYQEIVHNPPHGHICVQCGELYQAFEPTCRCSAVEEPPGRLVCAALAVALAMSGILAIAIVLGVMRLLGLT